MQQKSGGMRKAKWAKTEDRARARARARSPATTSVPGRERLRLRAPARDRARDRLPLPLLVRSRSVGERGELTEEVPQLPHSHTVAVQELGEDEVVGQRLRVGQELVGQFADEPQVCTLQRG